MQRCEKTKRAPGVFVDNRESKKVQKRPVIMHVMMMMMRGVTVTEVVRLIKKKDHEIEEGKGIVDVRGSDRIGETKGTDGIRQDAHSPICPKRSPPISESGVMTNFMWNHQHSQDSRNANLPMNPWNADHRDTSSSLTLTHKHHPRPIHAAHVSSRSRSVPCAIRHAFHPIKATRPDV